MEVKHRKVIGKQVMDMLYGKGFLDIDLQFVSGPTKGDGMHGMILYAKISAVKDGTPQKLNVVIKCAPFNETFRQTMPVRNLFLREILFYTKIVPIYDNLWDQLCVPREMWSYLPKCYGCCDDFKQETVVLEDLTKMGFRVMTLKELDYEHTAIILRSTAKLHALSFIFEERHTERFKKIAQQFIDDAFISNDEYKTTYAFLHGEKVMEQFLNAIDDMPLRKRCGAALGSNAILKFKDIAKDGKIKTIIHGDNWQGNYMFKYQNGKPTEAIPIDFQWSRYGSIAYDIMYIFTFSISKELRRNLFHQLVAEYYAGFQDFLAFCGYDAKNFFTNEQLKEELKCQSLICLVALMTGIPFFENPGFTLPELTSSPDNYAVTENYKLVVNDMVTTWETLGFI